MDYKENTMKEDKNNFITAVDKVKQRIAAGESPYDVFTWCGSFHEGFACVVLNDKWNYINHDGELISNVWFDDCRNFNNGLARVKLNGRVYLLRNDGVLYDYNTKEPVKMEE
jgi:hypothetical protein